MFPTKVARAAGSGASVPVECCQVCGHAPLTNVLSLGYAPRVPLDEGLPPTLKWYWDHEDMAPAA